MSRDLQGAKRRSVEEPEANLFTRRHLQSVGGGGSSDHAASVNARFVQLRRSGDLRLRDELIMEHGWIAERCAARFARRGEPYEDLLQVAYLALLKAMDRYNPEDSNEFPRYAVPTVIGEIRRHFRDHTWSMRVGRRAKDLVTRMNAAIETLTQRLGRSPTAPEVAAELGVDVEDVLEALEARNGYRPESLSHARPSGNSTVEDFVGDADRSVDSAAERIELWAAARTLDPRSRRILVWRFYEGLTQREIGERLGIGQMQVSRLLRSALVDLRSAMEDDAQCP